MQKDIEIFLFGPVWATLCHQHGMLPLHASAIVTKAGNRVSSRALSNLLEQGVSLIFNQLEKHVPPLRSDAPSMLLRAWPVFLGCSVRLGEPDAVASMQKTRA